jgi:hypothetical protein
MTPEFRAASGTVFSDVINEHFSVGGNVVAANPTACFPIDGGCGVVGVSSPNNTPYTIFVSGTINSSGRLSFISTTSGVSNFTYGPGATFVSDSFYLDPLIQLTVPEGVIVTSASGVFPITVNSPVPEPSSAALMVGGLAWLGYRRHKRRGQT